MRRRREQDPDGMREYNREWFRLNRNRHVEHNRKRRALKLSGTAAELLDVEWEHIKIRQRGVCYYCGRENGSLSQDHVVPLSRGGLHTSGNIVGACKSCNSSKCDSFIVEWKRRGGVVKGY